MSKRFLPQHCSQPHIYDESSLPPDTTVHRDKAALHVLYISRLVTFLVFTFNSVVFAGAISELVSFVGRTCKFDSKLRLPSRLSSLLFPHSTPQHNLGPEHSKTATSYTMKYTLLILSAVTSVSAYADFGNWKGPGKDDIRGPCPVLNTLANHHLIPHDGRDLTVPILVKGMTEGLNVSAEVATTLSFVGISTSKDPASGKFDLDDLNQHNKVEHDASLSRKDFDLGGESQAFCPETFNETLSFYKGANEVGIPEVAAARWGRVQSSKAHNPKFVYGAKQYFNSYFESASYFQLFRDPKTMKAKVDWIKVFFSEFVVEENRTMLTAIQAKSVCRSTRAGVLSTALMDFRLRRTCCCLLSALPKRSCPLMARKASLS